MSKIRVNPSKVAEIDKRIKKESRQSKIDQLTVSVNGYEFEADEVSQGRIAIKILTMQDGETTEWKLANNSVATVSKRQLLDVLKLASERKSQIWLDV